MERFLIITPMSAQVPPSFQGYIYTLVAFSSTAVILKPSWLIRMELLYGFKGSAKAKPSEKMKYSSAGFLVEF